MRKKALCIALALLMSIMVTISAYADNTVELQSEKALITSTFNLTHVSGSTYRMSAKIKNPTGATVSVTLTLYNASYVSIASIATTSSNTSINLSKSLTLSSGTCHLQLNYTVNGSSYTLEKTYAL